KLLQTEAALQKIFDVDRPTFRDDILGDDVVLAYRPAPDEHGLVLVRPRRPELLARLVDRVNDIQQQNGELKALDVLTYKGTTYRRRNDRGKELFYFSDGPVFAVAPREETLRAV